MFRNMVVLFRSGNCSEDYRHPASFCALPNATHLFATACSSTCSCSLRMKDWPTPQSVTADMSGRPTYKPLWEIRNDDDPLKRFMDIVSAVPQDCSFEELFLHDAFVQQAVEMRSFALCNFIHIDMWLELSDRFRNHASGSSSSPNSLWSDHEAETVKHTPFSKWLLHSSGFKIRPDLIAGSARALGLFKKVRCSSCGDGNLCQDCAEIQRLVRSAFGDTSPITLSGVGDRKLEGYYGKQSPTNAAPEGSLMNALQPTLDYLDTCTNIKFDWTVALPMLPMTDMDDPHPFFRHCQDLWEIRLDRLLSCKEYQAITQDRQSLDFVSIDAAACHAARNTVRAYFDLRGVSLPLSNETILLHDGIFNLLECMLRCFPPKGCVVLLPLPTFGYYITLCNRAGLRSVPVQTDAVTFRLSPDTLDAALRDHVSDDQFAIFLFTNPVNPTGVVYDYEQVEEFAAVLRKYPTVLSICDEIFADTETTGSPLAHSLLACAGLEDRVITLGGVSKSRGLPEVNELGVRFSFAVGSPVLMSVLALFREHCEGDVTLDVRPFTEARSAFYGLAAFGTCPPLRMYLRDAQKAQSDALAVLRKQIQKLNAQAGLPAVRLLLEPQSTSLVLLSFKGLCGIEVEIDRQSQCLETGVDVAYWLRSHGVALVPGEGFFIPAELMVLRLSLGIRNKRKGVDEWERGWRRIRKAVLEAVQRASVNRSMLDNCTSAVFSALSSLSTGISSTRVSL